MTKKAFIYISVLLLTTLSATAQNFYSAGEAGVSLGGAQYFGDMNEKSFNYIRPAGGLFFRYHFNPYISAKVSLNYAHVGYDDQLSDNPYQIKRNLNFQTDIIEASVQAEFNFLRFATGDPKNRFTPYLTGGFGVFYYNPYTNFNDRRYYLRPLGTEGQNVGYDDHKYNKTSFCFPLGVGVKYWLRPGINIGFEIADRLTLTDYMDDVSTYYVGSNNFAGGLPEPPPAYYLQDRSLEVTPSDPLGRPGKQRGNPSTRDQYMTAIFTISFQLKVYKCPGYMNRDFPSVD
jgi:hypothetical protein